MPTAITPVSNFHPVRAPSPGETRNNASYVRSLQGLTNRSVYLQDQMDALVTKFNATGRFSCAQYAYPRSGDWWAPSDYTGGGLMMVTLIGGGGGGGGGNRRATRYSGRMCPGKGGHAGCRQTFFLLDVPTVAHIRCGSGGAGGGPVDLVGQAGNEGQNGEDTTFIVFNRAIHLVAKGGLGGYGGSYNNTYQAVPPAALITRTSARGGWALEADEVYPGDPGIFPGGTVGDGNGNTPGGGGAGGWHLATISAPVLERIKEMIASGEKVSTAADLERQVALVNAGKAATPLSGKATTGRSGGMARPLVGSGAKTAAPTRNLMARPIAQDQGGQSDVGNGEFTLASLGGLGFGAGGAGGPSVYAGDNATGGDGANGAAHIVLWYPVTATA